MQAAGFDIVLYVVAAGAVFAGMLTVFLITQRRAAIARHELEAQIQGLADRLWEAREGEERARGLLEAQGDVIVRRDSSGRITYANDAFCALIGKLQESLLGSSTELPARERGAVTVQPDSTRI